MSNILYIPDLTPIPFHPIDPGVVVNAYLTRHMDDYPFEQTIKPWEEKIGYCQKIQSSDITNLQFISNFSPLQIDVIDVNGRVYDTVDATPRLQDKFRPGWFAYEATVIWDTLTVDTIYYLRINAGGVQTMISEPIYLKEIHKNTINFEYRNSRYHGGVIFETGITFSFRVEGSLGRLQPGSKDQYYDDQRFNPTVLSSLTYRNFRLSIGGSYGIPDWAVSIINNIFSCNDVRIDGKSYAKASDTKFEFHEEENYPMRGISMEIREGINRGSKIISPTIDTSVRVAVTYNIRGTVFGDTSNSSNNFIIITDTE